MPFDGNEGNEVHNLDDVDQRLYTRDPAGRRTPHIDSLHSRRFSIKKEWTDSQPAPSETPKKPGRHLSFYKKFFLGSLVFLFLAFAILLFTLFTGGNTVSNNNITISVLGNSFAPGGSEVPLQVEIVNKNPSDLILSDLFVDYDKGGDASTGATQVHDDVSIGTIPAGKTVDESVSVTLFGQEGSSKDITFTLQYHLNGSNAIFTKTSTFPVTLSSSPVTLSVDAPESVTPNQEITLTVKTVSNSPNTLSGMLLHVDYPTGFQFEKSVPAANVLNDVWDLGDLAPGAERDVVITGIVYGQDGEDQSFHAYTGQVSSTDPTAIGITYNSLSQVVSLVKPFIEAHILINGNDADTVPVSDSAPITGQVTYANNLPTEVTNAEITLSLSGDALDPSSVVSSNGFYDSTKQTITWNATTDPDLATLEPSDQGTLQFSFKSLPLVSGGTTIQSPSIKLAVSIAGQQPSQGGAVSSVNDFEEKTAQIDSDLGFSAGAFYAAGPFTNTGPIPPQAGQPTTYTVTWTVTNSANALQNGLAVATLPPYVDWVGTISPQSEQLTYDSATQSISWALGQVVAGAGYSSAARTVSFQVRLNPSVSQIDTTPNLVLGTTVTATDSFTGDALSTTWQPITTYLTNDPGFPPNGELVTN